MIDKIARYLGLMLRKQRDWPRNHDTLDRILGSVCPMSCGKELAVVTYVLGTVVSILGFSPEGVK